MDDLKLIKKDYGEKMMHFCRDNFPTVLECPGKLYKTLTETFYPSKLIYEDLMNVRKANTFIEIINEALEEKKEIVEEKIEVVKTPEELLDEAGYILYECHSEKDIQSFRHYYKRSDGKKLKEYVEGEEPTPYNGEELCTFNGDRLENCFVFFAIKKNVDEIKRENFKKPEREDEYGTSVISIQFSKFSNILSIKNRYNHTVANPDATFGNNLDNIIPGLSKAFETKLGIKNQKPWRSKEMSDYVVANDRKYYKYNFELNNIYYCPDNIIIDGSDDFRPKIFDKSRYLLFEKYIIDFQEKTISIYPSNLSNSSPDSFLKTFSESDEWNTKKLNSIKVETINKIKDKKITIDGDIEIIINQKGRIKHYKNSHITKIDSSFLSGAGRIESIDLPNVKTIGDRFLPRATHLSSINIPKVEKIGDLFLPINHGPSEINIPECRTIGKRFLYSNDKMKKISLPKVEFIDSYFLYVNEILEEINIPKVEYICNDFLHSNTALKEIDLPNVKTIENAFLKMNQVLKRISLPKCQKIYDEFLPENIELEELDLPSIVKIDDSFLVKNMSINRITLPNCESIGDEFLAKNFSLKSIDLPSVVWIGKYFLENNVFLNSINIPKCKSIKQGFLKMNKSLRTIDLSSVTDIEYVGNLEDSGINILPENKNVIIIFSDNENNTEYVYKKKLGGIK